MRPSLPGLLTLIVLGGVAAPACSTSFSTATAPLLQAELRLGPAPGASPALSSIEDDRPSAGDTGPYVEALSHPVVQLTADEDVDEPGGGFELEADLRTGSGYGLAAGVLVEGFGIGLLYLGSDHAERTSNVDATFHGVFVEARARGRHDLGPASGTLALGLGVGAGGIDFDDVFRDTGGTALEGRLTAGLEFHHVELEIGGGLFSWGTPGETVGTGAYLAAGLVLRF